MFIKWDCGCIGFANSEYMGKHFIIKNCDYQEYNKSILWDYRNMGNHTSKPLTEKEANILLKELGTLINQGQNFQEIKRLINNVR